MFSAAKNAAAAVQRLFTPEPPRRPRAPDGTTVYAIGDIHGRDDLLVQVLDGIREDAAVSPDRSIVVCLGDYVDRGPGSRAVLDMLIEAQADKALEWRFLRGNHDQSVLDFLHSPTTGMAWSDYGGRETLESYGVGSPPPWAGHPVWRRTAAAFAAALPREHLRFLQELELSTEIGDYFFVHAGVRPGVPLKDQVDRDMLWIREPFLSDPDLLEKVVVHGHTPTLAVHADDRRIGIDTGAYATGVLTALKLRGEEGAVIQTEPEPGDAYAGQSKLGLLT
jgi:serine/threonine protein phosphatase 1